MTDHDAVVMPRADAEQIHTALMRSVVVVPQDYVADVNRALAVLGEAMGRPRFTEEDPRADPAARPSTRPVLVLRLPVPMTLLVDVQEAYLRAYPHAGDSLVGDVIHSAGDVVTFHEPPDPGA